MSFPFKSLKEWIVFLGEMGELRENKTPVDLRGEVAYIAKGVADAGGPVFFTWLRKKRSAM